MAVLQRIEGLLKNLCLQLHVEEAQHIHEEGDARQQKLLRLTIKALQKLDKPAGAAMSLDEPTLGADLDLAADALSRRLGWMPPCGD